MVEAPASKARRHADVVLSQLPHCKCVCNNHACMCKAWPKHSAITDQLHLCFKTKQVLHVTVCLQHGLSLRKLSPCSNGRQVQTQLRAKTSYSSTCRYTAYQPDLLPDLGRNLCNTDCRISSRHGPILCQISAKAGPHLR